MKHLITCLALGIACAAGAQVNGFEPPYNPDSNADAFIGTHDLMDLLSAFGSAFEPDNIYVSTDSMHMLVLADVYVTRIECQGICSGMGNQWRVMNMADFGRYEFDASNMPGSSAWLNEPDLMNLGLQLAVSSSSTPNSQIWPYVHSSNSIGFSVPIDTKSCFCATQERPKVEYSYCEGTEIQSCADSKVADGWYPLGGPSTMAYYGEHKTQAFWRWAE